MSYVELGKVLFRGELRAANGEAKFKLTADAIDAVDSINIGWGEVSYMHHIRYDTPVEATKGQSLLTLVVDMPTDYQFVEINAYADGASVVRVNAIEDFNRYRSHVGNSLFSYSGLWRLSGQNTVSIISGHTGVSSSGWMLVKYLRETGDGYPS